MYSSDPSILQGESHTLGLKLQLEHPNQTAQQREAWRFLGHAFNLRDHARYGHIQLTLPERIDGPKKLTGGVKGFDAVLAKVDLDQTIFVLVNELKELPWRSKGKDNHAGWHCYPLDLDYKAHPHLAHLSPEEVLEAAKITLGALGITPGLAVDTTHKGLHLYVLFKTFIPAQAWPRLKHIIRALIEALSGLGADPKVSNRTQAIRLPGSRHQKTGQEVRIMEASGQRYSLEELESALGLEPRPLVRRQREERLSYRKAQRKRSLKVGRVAQARRMMADLIHLGKMVGEVPEGSRIEFLYQMVNTYCAFALHPARAARLVYRWRDRFCPSLTDREILGELVTAIKKSKTGGYNRLSSARFADLAISLGQEQNPDRFNTPLDDDERRRRATERKRAQRRRKGMKSAEAYHRERLRAAQSRASQASRLRARGLGVSAIAAKLGISRASIYNYLKPFATPARTVSNYVSPPPVGGNPRNPFSLGSGLTRVQGFTVPASYKPRSAPASFIFPDLAEQSEARDNESQLSEIKPGGP